MTAPKLEKLTDHQISWLRFTLSDELKCLNDMSFINADTVHDALKRANDKMIPLSESVHPPKDNHGTE